MKTVFGLVVLFLLLLFWLMVRHDSRKQRAKKSARRHAGASSRQSEAALNILKTPSAKPKETQRFLTINSLSTDCPDELSALHLLSQTELDDGALERCSEIIQSIKRPHPALQKMTAGLSADELTNVMKGCPDITAKILTTVNSAAFGLAQPITSINHAIIYLGLSLVQSIATQFMVRNTMTIPQGAQSNAYKCLWSASYVTSSVAFLMAQSLGMENASEIATDALLQSIGELALVSHQPEFAEFYLANPSVYERVKMEQGRLGLNAAIVGSRLARKWQLPERAIYVIEHSLDLLHYPERLQGLSDSDTKLLTFCFIAARVGDAVAFNGLRDISQFDINQQGNLDFFYLQQALNEVQLERCIDAFKDKQFCTKINKIIARVT